MCEISKKSIKHVTSNEKSAQNTYERNREMKQLLLLLVVMNFDLQLLLDALDKMTFCVEFVVKFKNLPSISAVQSMAVKKVQLVLSQQNIRMLGNKLKRSAQSKNLETET